MPHHSWATYTSQLGHIHCCRQHAHLLPHSRVHIALVELELRMSQQQAVGAGGEVPGIFLSHSGAQKDFTTRLYLELRRAGHVPFFDQDAESSLPKGHPFPERIVQACCGCKMGVVVLSHDYIQSFWPMLELEYFTFHNPADVVYPLFYCLQPSDLSDEVNLAKWKSTWKKEAPSWKKKMASSPITFNISSWPKALEMLRHRSGEPFPLNMTTHAYIQRIVSNICVAYTPPFPFSLTGDHLKGMDRMKQEINDLFRPQGVTALGIHGVGGSGKTTLCMNMTNFYVKDFPGRSHMLELSSEKDEKLLSKALKQFLPNSVKSFNDAQALVILEKWLSNGDAFLAIDNVLDSALEIVKQILVMERSPGSKIMITSRSKPVLEKLGNLKIVEVPSMNEEEAVGALLSYSCESSYSFVIKSEDLKSLAQACFFDGHCHPLLLKAMGTKLRHMSGHVNQAQGWKDLISYLQSVCIRDGKEIEAPVLSVLGTSFRGLPPELRDLLSELVAYVPEKYYGLRQACQWLSMLHDGSPTDILRYQVIQLEYFGLLEISRFKEVICIHDLYKHVVRTALGIDALGKCLFDKDSSFLSVAEARRKLMYVRTNSLYTKVDTLNILRLCTGLVILELDYPLHVQRLSVQGMQSLCYLRLLGCNLLKVIDGLQGAPRLLSIELRDCSSLQQLSVKGLKSLCFLRLFGCSRVKVISGLQEALNLESIELRDCSSLLQIGDLGCLQKLAKFVMKESGFMGIWDIGCLPKLAEFVMKESGCTVPDLTQCYALKTLVFSSKCLKSLSSLGQPPKLQNLDLSDNVNLVDVGTVGFFTALQRLRLCGCSRLEKFPDVNSSKLIILNLSNCENLLGILGDVCYLTSLQELDVSECSKLVSLSNLKNLAKLRILRATNCRSLKGLEWGVSGLTCLEFLDLYGCTSLEGLNLRYSGTASQKLELDLRKLCFLARCNGRLTNLQVLEAFRQLLGLPLHCLEQLAGKAKVNKSTAGVVRPDTGIRFDMGMSRIVSVDWIPRTPGGFEAFVNLQELKLVDARYSQISLLNVRGLTSLERLSLVAFTSLQQIEDLGALTKLCHLHLEKCPSLEKIPGLGNLTRLQIVKILDCPTLETLSDLKQLEFLKDLMLSGCSALSVVPGLTQLINLQVHGEISFRALSHFPPGLMRLSIQDCPSLTGIRGLSILTRIQDLEILNCPRLETLLDLGHLRSLTDLTLSGCSALVAIPGAEGLTNLKVLKLCGDKSLRAFSRFPPCLVRLSLQDCSCLEIVPDLPISLRDINISRCRSLKDASSLNSLPSLRGCQFVECYSLFRGNLFWGERSDFRRALDSLALAPVPARASRQISNDVLWWFANVLRAFCMRALNCFQAA